MVNTGIQEGIYYDVGATPGKFFSIIFLRAERSMNITQTGNALRGLLEMYQGLKKGKVRDLSEHLVPHGNLTVLIGYGSNIFKLPEIKRPSPSDLTKFGLFRSPIPTGGGPLLVGSGLQYAENLKKNPATEDFVVQFISDTQLSAFRPIIETWKYLDDIPVDIAAGTKPLLFTSFYTGFQRDDHRSWIDFHDGVSNLKSGDERKGAIAIKRTAVTEDQWTENGTFIAFIRLGIDLRIWRKISRLNQEITVGRDKLSGCPIESIDGNGNPVAVKGCPIDTTLEIFERGNEKFRETMQASTDSLNQSHILRAHHLNQGPANDPSSLRIFRQGYEFLEPSESSPGFITGLNFVSFQDTPQRLFRMLTTEGWLGKTNFGGDPNKQLPGMDKLLSVRAAGIYFVPPVSEKEIFPGSSILL
jgi:deferrochelatase/peroxidase EfeB